MNPNDIIAAGVLPNDRTWVVLSDGSRWEYRFDDGNWGWERVHRGLPGVAWQPTSVDATGKQRAIAKLLPEVARG